MNTKQSNLPSRGTRGFTLIEVVLALGVVAFAFVALMGLMPVGLEMFRNSIDTSVRAQIVEHVTTDAMETDFDALISSSNAVTTIYFDDQGDEVTQPLSIYQVQVTVTGTTQLPAPAASGTNANNTDLAMLLIQIANNPAHAANPFPSPPATSGTGSIPVSVATSFVARNEHL